MQIRSYVTETILVMTALVVLVAPFAGAQEWKTDNEHLSDIFSKKDYSPYAGRSFPEMPLWGDTHLHTSLSFDAGAFGNRLDPRAAYRFARGEEVISSTGQPVRLGRPLDWLAITDHSDGMGFTDDALAASPFVTNYEQGARWSKAFRASGQEAVEATLDMIQTFSQAKMDPEMFANYSPGSRRYATLWDQVIKNADDFNDPGQFTAFNFIDHATKLFFDMTPDQWHLNERW